MLSPELDRLGLDLDFFFGHVKRGYNLNPHILEGCRNNDVAPEQTELLNQRFEHLDN